jgi:hypothetical protein
VSEGKEGKSEVKKKEKPLEEEKRQTVLLSLGVPGGTAPTDTS